MAKIFTTKAVIIALLMVIISCFTWEVWAGNFIQNVGMTWGNGRGRILNNGQLLTLSLDRTSGSGFRSKKQYLFGKIDMQIKLVPGDSAGTVTTFYLSSLGGNHDEIDFEFLGNQSGEPYALYTNVYTQGKGSKEQQFYLWFDPTKDFHTYSITWNPHNIIFYVDGTPIRQFKNLEYKGIFYPKNQPMWVYASLWDAEDWATRGGLVKTDWTKAPFSASFRNFNVQTCPLGASCPWMNQVLDTIGLQKIKWVQKNYMIYNYCTDFKRFPQGFPLECNMA